jgi:hypothetical protein
VLFSRPTPSHQPTTRSLDEMHAGPRGTQSNRCTFSNQAEPVVSRSGRYCDSIRKLTASRWFHSSCCVVTLAIFSGLICLDDTACL